jgi:hypothetical protein
MILVKKKSFSRQSFFLKAIHFKMSGPIGEAFKMRNNGSRSFHGLRTPIEASFHQNLKLLGFGRQFGLINFWEFVFFSANLAAPILVQ